MGYGEAEHLLETNGFEYIHSIPSLFASRELVETEEGNLPQAFELPELADDEFPDLEDT